MELTAKHKLLCNEKFILGDTKHFTYEVKYNTNYKFVVVGTYGNGFKAYSNELFLSTYSEKFTGTCQHDIEYRNGKWVLKRNKVSFWMIKIYFKTNKHGHAHLTKFY